MTERQLRTLEENCLNDANRLYCSLQQLAIAASEVLGYEVVADICEGEEIEFRRVAEDGVADAFSCIRMEEIIERLNNR